MKSSASLPVIGIDIAKNVFQHHCVEPETGEMERHKIKRKKVSAFFANRKQSLMAMEACGGAQHWACSTSTILTAQRQLSWPVEAGDKFHPLLAWADFSHRCGHPDGVDADQRKSSRSHTAHSAALDAGQDRLRDESTRLRSR